MPSHTLLRRFIHLPISVSALLVVTQTSSFHSLLKANEYPCTMSSQRQLPTFEIQFTSYLPSNGLWKCYDFVNYPTFLIGKRSLFHNLNRRGNHWCASYCLVDDVSFTLKYSLLVGFLMSHGVFPRACHFVCSWNSFAHCILLFFFFLPFPDQF